MAAAALVALGLFLTLVIGSVYCIVSAGSLPVIVRILAILPMSGVALFSIYGFLASGEPGLSPLWKVGYSILFLVTFLAAARLATARRCVKG